MAKSDKLYNNSPKLERDEESGEIGIKRPSEADAENLGLSGNPLPGTPGSMPIQIHQVTELLARHNKEITDLLNASKESK